MKKIKYLSIIGLLLVAFISNAQKPRYIKTDTYKGVAFSKYWATYPKEEKYEFMPSNKEIAAMEAMIPKLIGDMVLAFEKREASTNGSVVPHCKIAENLKDYKRQYCGFWEKGKNREKVEKVIVAFFFITVTPDWKKQMIITGGGPTCDEFKIYYSATYGKLFGFSADYSPI